MFQLLIMPLSFSPFLPPSARFYRLLRVKYTFSIAENSPLVKPFDITSSWLSLHYAIAKELSEVLPNSLWFPTFNFWWGTADGGLAAFRL